MQFDCRNEKRIKQIYMILMLKKQKQLFKIIKGEEAIVLRKTKL